MFRTAAIIPLVHCRGEGRVTQGGSMHIPLQAQIVEAEDQLRIAMLSSDVAGLNEDSRVTTQTTTQTPLWFPSHQVSTFVCSQRAVFQGPGPVHLSSPEIRMARVQRLPMVVAFGDCLQGLFRLSPP